MAKRTTRCLLAACIVSLTGCGNGASSTAVGAPPTSRGSLISPSPTIQQHHLLTMEYFGNPSNVTWSQMAHNLDWAILTDFTASESGAALAAGIRTMLYTNPNRQGPGDPMYTHIETTFAHDCFNNRITFPRHPGKYLMDPHSSHLAQLWKKAVANANGQFDAILEDAAVTVVGVTNALPCNFTQADWDNATNAMDSKLGQPILENSNLGKSGGLDTVALGLALVATTIGGLQEECYSNEVPLKPRGDTWLAMENTEIQFGLDGKIFVCRSNSNTAAATSQDERIYMLASFLLTYNPGTSIISEHFKNPSGFEVEPESQLVSLNPLVAQPSDASGVEQSPFVYGRQYQACYVNSSLIGPCAVAINIDAPAIAHPFPWAGTYSHTLTLTGGGILDGGTMSTSGPAPAAQIAGDSAVVVFR